MATVTAVVIGLTAAIVGAFALGVAVTKWLT